MLRIAEFWWVQLPILFRRYWLFLAEAWHDGIYLTRWPVASLLIPLLVVLFGLFEGATHWNPILASEAGGGSIPTITFTEMLLLLMVAAALGALSAQAGFLLVLGYGIGDFFLYSFLSSPYYTAPNYTIFDAILYQRLPLLITYILFCLLTVSPTLMVKYLVESLRRFLKGNTTLIVGLRMALAAIIQGFIVYYWTLSVPIFIRVIWGWINSYPPLTATYYVQSLKFWIIAAAVLAALGRGLLTAHAYKDLSIRLRIRRLVQGLKQSDQQKAFTRRLPDFVQAIIAAVGITLLLSGIIPNLLIGVVVFLFLSLLFLLRLVFLPRLGFWTVWSNLVTRVPLLIRLIACILIISVLAQWFLSSTAYLPVLVNTASGSFQWLLIGVCLSLLVITTLVPQKRENPALSAPNSKTREDLMRR